MNKHTQGESKLKKAAFNIGDVVEYQGNSLWHSEVNGKMVPSRFKGMKATIIKVKPPEIGLGFIKNDEDGEPIIDHDHDGCNVAINEHGYDFLIWPDNKKDWRKI